MFDTKYLQGYWYEVFFSETLPHLIQTEKKSFFLSFFPLFKGQGSVSHSLPHKDRYFPLQISSLTTMLTRKGGRKRHYVDTENSGLTKGREGKLRYKAEVMAVCIF